MQEYVVRLAHPDGKLIGRLVPDAEGEPSVGAAVVVSEREWRVVELRDGVLVVVPAVRS